MEWGDRCTMEWWIQSQVIFSGCNVTMIFSLLEKTQPKGGADTAAELHLLLKL